MPHNHTPRAAPRRALERPLTKICAAMVTRISMMNRRNRGGRTGRTTLEVVQHGGQRTVLCRTEMPLAMNKRNSVSGIDPCRRCMEQTRDYTKQTGWWEQMSAKMPLGGLVDR